MGWLTFKDDNPKPQQQEPVEPFHVDITDEEYMRLPWTVQLVDGQWHCMELDLKCKSAEAFDLMCRQEARMHLSKAVDGIAPPLPAGYMWKEGKPARDPGPTRLATTRRFK